MLDLTPPQKIILIVGVVVALAIGGWVLLKTMPEEGDAIDVGLAGGSAVSAVGAGPSALAGEKSAVVVGATAGFPGGQVTVYVSGAVKNEGIVKLPSGARLLDVLNAAGGLLRNADVSQINLAEKVSDGQKIDLPYLQVGQEIESLEKIAALESVEPAQDAKKRDREKKGSIQKSAEKLTQINVNTAKASDLEKIKGIGPKMAQNIINYRQQHGKFSQLSDLLKVKGIGSSKLKILQDYVCF
jgi:competence protein ComEA